MAFSGSRDAATDLWFPAPAEPRRRVWPWLLGVCLLLMLLGGFLLGISALWWSRSDLILPGAAVGGVSIGNQSKTEAEALLAEAWQGRSLRLEVGEEAWLASRPALGLVLDATATVEQAYRHGRSWSTLRQYLEDGARLDIRPVWTFERAEAGVYLETFGPQVEIPAVDAGVAIVNGRAEVTPAETGRALNVSATLAALDQNPAQILTSGTLTLITQPVQPEITDTSQVAAAANELLATSLTIRAFDPVTGETVYGSVAPDSWGQWLTLEIRDPAVADFDWVIDEAQLQSFLSSQAEAFGPERYLNLEEAASAVSEAIKTHRSEIALRVYHHDRQHVVQSGETLASIGRDYGIPYPWIQQANSNLDSGLYPGQTIVVPSPDALLPLPVVTDKRIVVSILQQRVWVYENGDLKWEWPASTGINDSPTAPGIFQIQSHEPNAYAANWDLWMPNFMGVYRPVPTSGFMNGFHGFPTRSGSQLLWTGDLGHKVTYGCILLSSNNAATLYEWAEEGVVVEIRP
jgi:lipoprotein-anchoring transpeptidase ErfK/SrfK